MRLATVLLALTVITTPFALAQAPAAPSPLPPCDGNLNIVRTSEIKPGMMARFAEAVAGQQAWYKAAGTPDQIMLLKVLVRDETTKAWSYSDTQALTFHIEPDKRAKPLPPHDAAWDAFVALYKESSTIKSESFTCMPKSMQ